MNQGQSNATGVITQAKQAQSTTATGRKQPSAMPQPRQRANGSWSIRARRMGADINLSGFASAHHARRAMACRLREISQRGLSHGQGPDRTTVAEAMQQYALQYLPRLRGAAQEARRINAYLRAARLASIEVCRVGSKKAPPPGAAFGRHFAVWLAPHESQRGSSEELEDNGECLLTGTTRVGNIRAAVANQEMTKVTWCHVQDLVRAMEAEGLACATVMREVQLLRRLFNCAARDWRWSALVSNPAVGVRVTGTPRSRGRIMSPEEQQRLEEAAGVGRNPVVGPALAFLTETGMHAQECINSARWEDIDWDRCIMRLPTRRWGSCSVPLAPRAMAILREHRLQDTPGGKVFNISFASLRSQWKRLCERAGIKDLRIGDLRRTAAVRLMHSSGNVIAMLAVTGFRSARFSRW